MITHKIFQVRERTDRILKMTGPQVQSRWSAVIWLQLNLN